jgi:hypothetical protein
VAADRFYITAKAGFWRLVGLGFVSCGLGAALGFGFYGYSYVTRNSENFGVFSSTFSKALMDVHLRATAEGTVELQPRVLSLADGQTVSIDPNSRVLLDPTAKVLADGVLQVQAPSISMPRSSTPQTAASRVPTITNFEVFKSVAFDKGTVMTGWKFLTSVQRAPTHQHCYYTYYSQNFETPGLNIDLDIGIDGRRETPKAKPKEFDMEAAFNRCVWFKSESP